MKTITLRFIYMLIGNFKRIVTKLSFYLKSGNYKINDTFSLIYNAESENFKNSTFDVIVFKENKLFKLVSKIFNCKQEKDGKYKGEFIIISSSRKEFKVFDIENRKVITYYLDKDRMNFIMKKRKQMEFFNLPKIYSSNNEDNVIIEDYIDSEVLELHNIYDKLCKQYIDYFKLQIENKNIKGEDIPLLLQHGDLWSSNVLIHDNEIYVIDYEKVDWYPFWYDLLFFIFQEAYIKNNFELLDKFINGEYDYIYIDLFDLFGEVFDDKKDLLNEFIDLFIYIKLKRRIRRKNMIKINTICERYELDKR